MAIQTALWPLQQAIYSRLNNDTALKSKISGVHDALPTDAEYPYVVIGNPIVNPFETKDSHKENIPWTLHCYSVYSGKKETMEILNLMLQALTKEKWNVQGFNVIKFNIEPNMRVIPPADIGFPYQGILNIRFYIEK